MHSCRAHKCTVVVNIMHNCLAHECTVVFNESRSRKHSFVEHDAQLSYSRMHSCVESCSRKHSCVDSCSRMHSCVESCSRMHSCVESCSRMHSCVESCSRMHSCVESCSRMHSCVESCSRKHICVEYSVHHSNLNASACSGSGWQICSQRLALSNAHMRHPPHELNGSGPYQLWGIHMVPAQYCVAKH